MCAEAWGWTPSEVDETPYELIAAMLYVKPELHDDNLRQGRQVLAKALERRNYGSTS